MRVMGDKYMVFNDVVDTYAFIKDEIDELIQFKGSLIKIVEQYENIGASIIAINNNSQINSNNWTGFQNQVKDGIKNIRVETQRVNLMIIGKLISKLETKINDKDKDLYNLLIELIDQIEKCSNTIYQFNNVKEPVELSNSLKPFVDTMKATITIIEKVDFAYQLLIRINGSLQINYLDKKEEISKLSIRIYNEQFTAKDIHSHMGLMLDIYERTCTIFNISTIEYPLIPAKIETGSLLDILLGHEKIMDFIEDLLNRTIGFIYRNYTKEGKLGSATNRVEAIKEHINLIALCEEHGINMDESKKIIEQNVDLLCNDLYKITTSSSKISVNGTIYDLGKESCAALIENFNTKRIANSDESLASSSNTEIATDEK